MHHVIDTPCHKNTRTSIPHISQSQSHPFTVLSTYHVICSSCYLFTTIVLAINFYHQVIMSLICHVRQSSYLSSTMSSDHNAIQSPYYPFPCHQFTLTMSSSQDHDPSHPFTLSSIHTYHVIHSPCPPVMIIVHAIYLPCHPFTLSSIQPAIN